MRIFNSILSSITVFPVIACANQAIQAQSNNGLQRPNIILIVADDLGYGELGCQGNPQIPTPNIDAIAANGVRFTSGYVSSSVSSPSRAGLLTGKYQTRFGYEGNPTGAKNEDTAYGLPVNQKTMANILHDSGYATGLIGKWHLGGTAVYHPERRGFDEFFGYFNEGHSYAYPAWNNVTSMYRRKVLPDGTKGRWQNGNVVYYTDHGYDEPPYDANNPIVRSSQPVEEHTYLTDAFTREALCFIERKKNQPFFLMLSHLAVHSPMQAKNDDMAKFSHIEDIQRRIFAGMLTSMDEGIGKITQKIRELGLEENTIIIFLSDNGGPTKELTSSNLPLRHGKAWVYEGGIRVPFMMQWKGKIPGGLVYDNPVISLDILPTVAKIAGAEMPEKIDGVDLMPYLTGKNQGQPHEYLYWRLFHMSALRMGDWKIVTHSLTRSNPHWELYNLNDDIGESINLKEKKPDEFEKLYKKWNELNGEMISPLFR
jgi:arylsulfatase A-like enzyme